MTEHQLGHLVPTETIYPRTCEDCKRAYPHIEGSCTCSCHQTKTTMLTELEFEPFSA